MEHTTRITNQRPYCPYCSEGYMMLRSVTLDTCPEVDADIEFEYGCNHCQRIIRFDQSDLTYKGFDYIGIAPMKAMREMLDK